jgi:acyl carrier protein
MRSLEKISEVLRESHGIEDAISPFTNFRQLGLDSLELAGFVLELEEVFGADIPDDQLKRMFTVQDVINYVNTRSAAV